MSFLFKLPNVFGDLLVISLRSVVPLSWSYCLLRILSSFYSLDLLSVLSKPVRFTSHLSYLEQWFQWFQTYQLLPLYLDLIFIFSFIEVCFSIYHLILIHRIQDRERVIKKRHSSQFLKNLIIKTLTTGLPSIPKSDIPHQTLESEQDQPIQTKPITYRRFTSLTSILNPNYDDEVDQYLGSKPNQNQTQLVPQFDFNHPHALDYRKNFLLWFRDCDWNEIQHDNFVEWLSSVLFNMTLDELKSHDQSLSTQSTSTSNSPTQHQESNQPLIPFIEDLIKAYERRTGSILKPGYNLKLQHQLLRPSLDPIRIQLRPFSLYALAYLTGASIRTMLKLNGFLIFKSQNRLHGSEYLIRIPKDWSPSSHQTPLVFIHGVGMGEHFSFIFFIFFNFYLFI